MPPDRESAELIEKRSGAVEARGISSTPHFDATAAIFGTEPPYFLRPDATGLEWETFARYPNHLVAQIVAGLLENEGLPTIVEARATFPGVDSAAVWVPKQLMHRARWIIALAPPSDAELLFLATSELSQEQR